MKKNNPDAGKHIKLESALLISFITLIVGFLGGIVFSAFRMETKLPATSGMVSGEQTAVETSTPDNTQRIADLEKAAAKTPEDASAWIALGNACFDGNQPLKAIHAYETALKYQPENADVWTDLGVMYRRNEQPKEAVAAFDKAQAIDPKHEASLFNKGIVQMHDLNDAAGAAETWNKLLQINPDATTPSGMPIKDLVEKLKKMQ